MNQPLWLAEAWAEFGQCERAGAASNDRVLALYRDAGHDEVRGDEVPWCAAFVGACLKRAGITGTKSLRARSYADWGKPVEDGTIGAVAVFSRGADPALGHVGFVVGTSNKTLFILGGNQKDCVNVTAFDSSRLIALRWPAAEPAQAIPAPETIAARDGGFNRALAHVLEMEGGYTDDPYDPGGPTNKGILLRELAHWKGVTLDATNTETMKRELRTIPDATVSAIYRKRYWEPASCDELPSPLALMHFDAAVNHGVGTAIRILQEAVGAEIDGEIGPLTRASIKETPATKALGRYADIRRRRYRALPTFWRFGPGWLNRVDATLAAARSIPAPAKPKTDVSNTGDRSVAKDQSKETATVTEPKWWGQSMTIWGVLITAISTVVPVLGPVIGVDISSEMVREVGGQAVTTVQAITGLAGTLMAIFGRIRAKQPLQRRDLSIRL